MEENLRWTTQFPVNLNGTPSAETESDVREMNGCRYTAVTHKVTSQRAVGIKVEAVSKFSCATTTALGGAGYLGIAMYGPTAYARLDTYAPLGRIAFTSSGSFGPSGQAASMIPKLSVKLIRASSGTTIRSTVQGMCSGNYGQIIPVGIVSVDATSGLFSIGGTKNALSGLPGETCTGDGAYLANFTLKYAGFASGFGTVPQPTIE